MTDYNNGRIFALQNIVLNHDHFCEHKEDVAVECGNLRRLAPFAEGVERDFVGRY